MFQYNTTMISRFFFPEPLPAHGEVDLPDALAHHATRVLRLAHGTDVVLFDGSGGERMARLQISGRQCRVALGPALMVERESPLSVVLVQALASADKMDWVMQKAVELGVTAVVPLAAERSVLKLSGERAQRRLAHWQQVVIAACEQSGRNRVPLVQPVTSLATYLHARQDAVRWVLAPGVGAPLKTMECPRSTLHLLVGPEGGWSEAELALCDGAGCVPVTLGPRVLRTETAGLAAMAALQALWGDF